jgi:hypothetical protein
VDGASSSPMGSFMAVVRVDEKKCGGITNIIQKLVTNLAGFWHKMLSNVFGCIQLANLTGA